MQEKKLTRAKIVIDALRGHYGLNIGAFAKMLGVGGSTVSTWALRDSLDEDLVFRKCDGVNYNFLLTGEGPMFTKDTAEYRKQLSNGLTKADEEDDIDYLREAAIQKLNKLTRVELARWVYELEKEEADREGPPQ